MNNRFTGTRHVPGLINVLDAQQPLPATTFSIAIAGNRGHQ
jgi:hypothetical protein